MHLHFSLNLCFPETKRFAFDLFYLSDFFSEQREQLNWSQMFAT